MRIVAPIANIKELEMLLHCGADELYCGIRTPEWEKTFGQRLWINRRSPEVANIFSLVDLKTICDGAHLAGARVFIAMNAPFYSTLGMNYVIDLCTKLVDEVGVDGLIIGDLNLLLALSERKLPVRIHLSSLGSCFNAEVVPFYRSLGVQRIILPRQLLIADIENLLNLADDHMEFEVFALNDGCFYEEGFCQTSHTLGAFCLADWTVRPRRASGADISADQMARSKQKYRQHLWFLNNCGSSFQQDGLPNGPCSLCWFGRFRDWGMTAVKIVGREASFVRKMGSLQLVKAVMDKVRQKAPGEEIAAYARSVRNTPEYCDDGAMCYFREN